MVNKKQVNTFYEGLLLFNEIRLKLQNRVEQKIDRRVEDDEAVGQALDVHQPRRPLFAVAAESLVDGGDEPPGMAEDEQPDDGQRNPGDSAFTASKDRAPGFSLKGWKVKKCFESQYEELRSSGIESCEALPYLKEEALVF